MDRTMARRSEHDEFMAEEERAYDHARRVAAKRGHFLPGPPLGPGHPITAQAPAAAPALKPAATLAPAKVAA